MGRSARAGEKGAAIFLCKPEENIYIKEIEKLIKQKIEVVRKNIFPQTDKLCQVRKRRNGRMINKIESKNLLHQERKNKILPTYQNFTRKNE